MTPHRPTEQELKRGILEDQAQIAELIQSIPNKDHEDRIREVEKWMWKMMGLGMVAGTLMTMFVGVCTWIVTDDIRRIREQIDKPAAVTYRK